jgi:hypothetical protein
LVLINEAVEHRVRLIKSPKAEGPSTEGVRSEGMAISGPLVLGPGSAQLIPPLLQTVKNSDTYPARVQGSFVY